MSTDQEKLMKNQPVEDLKPKNISNSKESNAFQKSLNSENLDSLKNLNSPVLENFKNECQNKSLYVGNLDPKVTESMLFEKFSEGLPEKIVSIKVCRHKKSKESLGYAYVNFKHTVDGLFILILFLFNLLLSFIKGFKLSHSNSKNKNKVVSV